MCRVYTIGEALEMSGEYHSFLEHLKELGIEPEYYEEEKEEE